MTPERTKEEILNESAEKYADNLLKTMGWCKDAEPGDDETKRWIMGDFKAGAKWQESQPVESKWVSVKERTPEFDGQYLCFIEAPQECGNIWRFQEVVSLHFNEWITSEDQYVTHWKPLDPNP